MQEKENIPQTNKNRKILSVCILLLCALALATLFYNYDLISNFLNEPKTKILKEQKPDLNSLKTLESDFRHNNKEELKEQSQSLAQIDNIISTEKVQDNQPSANLIGYSIKNSDYRNYLLNVNYLIISFLKDKIYTSQLESVRIFTFPQKIEIILDLMENYNRNFLLIYNPKNKKIFPLNSPLFEKFITIEKTTNQVKEKEILKKQIMKNLEIFLDYIYSEELQKLFINRDKK